MPPPKTPPDHGTRSCYVRWKCRCDACKAANRAYANARARLRKAVAQNTRKGTKKKTIHKLMPWSGKEAVFRKTLCTGVRGKPCPKNAFLKANSTGGLCYDCRQKLLPTVTVSAEAAKQHILKLSNAGIGTRAIAKAAKLGRTTIMEIRTGKLLVLRPNTERAVLAVVPKKNLPGHVVSSDKYLILVDKMVAVGGLTRQFIANQLGDLYSTGLQVGRKGRLKLRNAQAIEKLYEETMADVFHPECLPAKKVTRMINQILKETGMLRKDLAKRLGWPKLTFHQFEGRVRKTLCDEIQQAFDYYTGGEAPKKVANASVECIHCGLSHAKKDRLERIKKSLPCTLDDLVTKYGCVYPRKMRLRDGVLENRMVFRDLEEVGAVPSSDFVWSIPTPIPPHREQIQEVLREKRM
jgi:hypothetical protein